MAAIGGTTGELLGALTSHAPYKPGQGRWARYGTFVVIVGALIWGGYSWSRAFPSASVWTKYVGPSAVAAVGIWIGYRLIHWPRFADFLITTEGEIAKVTWPTQHEVKLSTIVVLVLAVLMAAFLFSVDRIWQEILYRIGILEFVSSVFGDG
jgi:preprotein translocase subunit SecE